MPKRKRKEKRQHIKSKIRRLQGRLENYYSDSSNSEDDYDYEYDRYYETYPGSPVLPASDTEGPVLPLSDSDNSIAPSGGPKSVVVPSKSPVPVTAPVSVTAPVPLTAPTEPTPSTSAQVASLPQDILEALGDPKAKEEAYGPKIPDEVSERWGRVLPDGLAKDQKEKLPDKHLIPDNFRLVKAPKLNPELIPVLSETARYRDKLMETSQNQLGRGIAELSYLTSAVINTDLAKLDILKKISDITQIFLDLHHGETKRRRKLVASSLDKKFLHVITDVKRDEYLFGTDLGNKIKACKTAERSGLQIKRKDATTSYSGYKKYSQQGNWRGPPRAQAQPARRRGGPRPRHAPPPRGRRPPPPAADRPPRATPKDTNYQKT